MTTIALVHGAWHGAWCFERFRPHLAALGHDSVAMDLPVDDASAGARRYAEVVAEALADVTDDVVVLGHSMAGLAIPLVAELRPVRGLMFVCALLPRVGRAVADAEEPPSDPVASGLEVDSAGTTRRKPGAARAFLFGRCDPAVAAAAMDRLRPQASRPFTEPSPLTRWPDVPATAIYCVHDPVVPASVFGPLARARLGGEPRLMPGDHSPFLSQPGALASLVHQAIGELASGRDHR